MISPRLTSSQIGYQASVQKVMELPTSSTQRNIFAFMRVALSYRLAAITTLFEAVLRSLQNP